MRIRNLAFTTLAVLALVAPAVAGGDHAHDHSKANVGHMAPDFELIDHAGNVHKLSDYKGKTVVLEWTNPQCPFVVRHYDADTMTSLAKANEDVVWLAIDSSHFVTAESATKWAKKEDITYPILLDASGEVGKLYNARTTPHMFVVDAKGMLVYDGAIDDDARGKNQTVNNFVAAALTSLAKGASIEMATTKPYGCSVKYAKPEKATKTSR